MVIGQTILVITFSIFIISKCNQPNQKTTHFPRIVWTYWHQGIQSASTFTKLCLNNQKIYAEESGWQFRLVHADTLHQYLDAEKIYKIWKYKGGYLVQSLADIIRMFLLYQYGGMWIDANSFFVQNFTWLDNLKDQPYIYNKQNENPLVLLGSLSDDPYIEYDTEPDNKIYPMPNLEVWFMVATPKSEFYRDVLIILEEVAKMSLKQANQHYGKLGVNQRFNYTDYFMMSNYIFQIVVQLKEIEINKNNSAERKYAVNYYKIWNMEAYKTAFALYYVHQFKFHTYVSALFEKSIRYYQKSIKGPRYFLKHTSLYYDQANKILDNFRQMYCLGHHIQIKNGSIVDEFLIKKAKDIESLSHLISDINQLSSGQRKKSFCSQYQQNSYKIITIIQLSLLFILVLALAIKLLLRRKQFIEGS